MEAVAHSDQRTGVESRNDLISEYRSFVGQVAAQLITASRIPVDFYDDLVADGYLGLVEAAERYKPTAEGTFKKFAFLRIRGAMIDGIRRSSLLSPRAYRLAKAFEAAHDLRQECAQSGDDPLIADRRSKLETILNRAVRSALIYRLAVEDVDAELAAFHHNSPALEEVMIKTQRQQKLLQLVRSLPVKERLIVEEFYFHNKSFANIADIHFNRSRSWVSRLHSRAIEKLRMAVLSNPEAYRRE